MARITGSRCPKSAREPVTTAILRALTLFPRAKVEIALLDCEFGHLEIGRSFDLERMPVIHQDAETFFRCAINFPRCAESFPAEEIECPVHRPLRAVVLAAPSARCIHFLDDRCDRA